MTDPQKLSIDTPEQINLEYGLAGLGSRFLALLLDMVIQGVAMVVMVIVPWFLLYGILKIPARRFHLPNFLQGHESWVLGFIVFAIFAAQWGYFAFFEIIWQGQTPGKRRVGIRVINETGRPATAYESIARNLLRAIDSLPGVYAVGAVAMFLSPQSKRIGDYVAGTVVIHDRRPEEDRVLLDTSNDAVADDIQYASLSASDLQVMETFLQRRRDLPLDVRQRTAEELARHYRGKCQVQDGCYPDNETLLELLVRGIRRDARFLPR